MPNSVLSPLQSAYNSFATTFDTAYAKYKTAEEKVVGSIKQAFPEKYRPLCERIGRAIPETLATAALVTGQLRPFAYIYGTIRFIWIALPVGKAFVDGKLDKETMAAALNQTKERLQETMTRFSPAILATFAINSVAHVALSVVRLRPGYLFEAALHAIIARLAMNDLPNLKAFQSKDIPAPAK